MLRTVHTRVSDAIAVVEYHTVLEVQQCEVPLGKVSCVGDEVRYLIRCSTLVLYSTSPISRIRIVVRAILILLAKVPNFASCRDGPQIT